MTEVIERVEDVRRRRFRPYPEHKDSGVEWLGEIPAHWEVKKWRYCCHVTKGQVGGDDEQFRERILIAPNHIESGTGRILYLETADEQGAISGKYLVGPGDIVYSKIRPALNKACISTGNWLCSADMYPVSITESRLQTRFLLYFMLSEPFVRLVVDDSMRVAMPKINRDTLATCPLLVPEPDEQDAIIDFLDRETAKIDALMAKKMRLIELLREKRTALITRAVTRGLDPNVPMKDSGGEWLGEIPAHWDVKRLRHIVRHIEQGWSPDCENREADADEWGVLKAGCVNRGRFLESENKALPSRLSPIPALEIKKGDLLMSRASGSRDLVGSVAVVPECRPQLLLCDKVFRLHTVSSAGHRGFIGYAMNSRVVRWQIESVISGGNGLASNISQEAVKDLVLVQPPRTEEQKIAGYLDCETTRVDALIAKVHEAIDHLKEFRTALISAAVTGKIDVRAASDEPATGQGEAP